MRARVARTRVPIPMLTNDHRPGEIHHDAVPDQEECAEGYGEPLMYAVRWVVGGE